MTCNRLDTGCHRTEKQRRHLQQHRVRIYECCYYHRNYHACSSVGAVNIVAILLLHMPHVSCTDKGRRREWGYLGIVLIKVLTMNRIPFRSAHFPCGRLPYVRC